MNEADFQELLEASWRRRLTPEEEAQLRSWLAVHPELQAEWEAETHLNRLLTQLPEAPVPSNFTSLVLQAARRESSPAAARSWRQRLAGWLLPRPSTGLAWASFLLCVSWFAWHQARVQTRAQHARDLAVLSCALLPEPKLLAADFEAVRRLPQVEDDELLAVLDEATTAP